MTRECRSQVREKGKESAEKVDDDVPKYTRVEWEWEIQDRGRHRRIELEKQRTPKVRVKSRMISGRSRFVA